MARCSTPVEPYRPGGTPGRARPSHREGACSTSRIEQGYGVMTPPRAAWIHIEQKLTDLGGVVAAAAHELGTPLATIKLASAELLNDLKDNPDLAEDAALRRLTHDSDNMARPHHPAAVKTSLPCRNPSRHCSGTRRSARGAVVAS